MMKKLFVILSLAAIMSSGAGITSYCQAADPIVLKMAPINCAPPPSGGSSRTLDEMAKLIGTRSNGLVKIDAYWAQSLSPVTQIVNSTSTGIADIGAVAPAQEPGKLPLSMVGQLPGFGTDWWALSMAFWDLMNQEPLLSEYKQHNLLPFSVNFVSDYYLIANKPIRSVADLKGKKIQAAGFFTKTLSALGAVPLAMTPPEQYEGLQKGIIDGNLAGYAPIGDFKFYEVAKYITTFPFGGRVQPVLINKNSWNKLPADVQKIITDSVQDIVQINVNNYFSKDEPLYPLTSKLLKDNNVEIIHPSDADRAALRTVQAGQADEWAAEQEKAGRPGSKLLSDYRTLVEKYNKVSTFAFK